MNLCSSISTWGEFIFDRVSYVYSLLFTIYFFNLSLSVSVRLSRNFSLIFRDIALKGFDPIALWCLYIYESGMCRLLHRYFRTVASQLWHYIKWKTLTIVCQVNIVCTVIISRPGGERGHSTNLLFIFAQPENWGRIALCSRALYVHTLQSTLMLSCYSRCF